MDKETYLITREANGSYIDANGEEYSNIKDIKYQIGNVTDEEVKRPDLAGYIVRQIQ